MRTIGFMVLTRAAMSGDGEEPGGDVTVDPFLRAYMTGLKVNKTSTAARPSGRKGGKKGGGRGTGRASGWMK